MRAKYDASYLPRAKTCTVYFYLLFLYDLQVYSYLAVGKRLVIKPGFHIIVRVVPVARSFQITSKRPGRLYGITTETTADRKDRDDRDHLDRKISIWKTETIARDRKAWFPISSFGLSQSPWSSVRAKRLSSV